MVYNGTLKGGGNLHNLNNNGILEPGVNEIGRFLIIGGDYNQTSTSTLNMQLVSTASFDQVYLNGSNSNLNETLNVSLFNGFIPVAGNSFKLLS